jgi:NhaA family Na+:H+ antiporter
LPGIAALGGMIVPAAIYLAFNGGPDGHPRGWAIPAATDIAFALGVGLGLFVGKQVGVFAFSWVAIRMDWADLPANATWAQFYGVALLCGIGFTMSLFIGLLAFPTSPELQDATKLGVLLGSGLSALVGAALLGIARPEAKPIKSR